MDAQKREISQPHHQPNLKRPWLSPNDRFDTQNHDFKSYSSRGPERAREHLRAGYLHGIINPERNGSRESPYKKIRSSNAGEGLEKHIFPRTYATQGDPIVPERTPAHDSRPAFPSQTGTTQSSSPSGSIGSNERQPSVRESSESSLATQHKSLLITDSPGCFIGAKFNRESSKSESFQPTKSNGVSHSMQLDCNPLLQEVAVGLSKLASIILTGKHPEADGEHNPTKDDRGESNVKCPDVAQLGTKETLHWMLGVIQNTTCLAETTIQGGTLGSSLENERTAPATSGHRPDSSKGPLEIMKRRFLDDDIGAPQNSDQSLEESRRFQDSRESISRDYIQARDRRTTAEELPSMQSQSPFSLAFPHTGFVGRTPAMNPPPAPNRHLPISPPRASPTLYNLPSPASNSAFSQPSNSINLPSPHSLNSGSIGNLLHHPISPSSSIDATAVTNAHTAALQHDVSIRTLALQSLQHEHNNLLAAFSRSQTRAVALEKKHIVSDAEINSLSEERTRLQAQVSELEKSVEELSRSRDEARQSAVQEGAQYVQMIKMAGQLEEKGREERRAWERLKKEMEERIERLIADAEKANQQQVQLQKLQMQKQQLQNQHKQQMSDGIAVAAVKARDLSAMIQDQNTPPSSAEAAVPIQSTSSPPLSPISSTDILISDLRKEIQSLRDKCMEFEQTLLAVRSESREIDIVLEALGKAGRRIREGVDKSLGGGDGLGLGDK